MKSLLDKNNFTLPNDTEIFKIETLFEDSLDNHEIFYVKDVEQRDYSISYIVKNNNVNYFMKFIFTSTDKSIDMIITEIKINHKCAKLGIAPDIKLAFIFELGGIIIMDLLDIEFGSYLVSNNVSLSDEEIFTNVISLMEKLHKENICHGDLTCHNIMLNDKLKFFIIDYGESFFLTSENKQKMINRDFFMLEGFADDLLADYDTNEKVKKFSSSLQNYLKNNHINTENFEIIDHIK